MEIRLAADRGKHKISWLDSKHSFSFGQYYDPKQLGFSDLLVLNDDTVSPSGGFGKHPHRDMEIFSYVLSGSLEHKDSMGTGSTIRPGDVQMMSAGTGITHSEFNPSHVEPVHFLQFWIVPNQKGVTPRYQQKHFAAGEKRGVLRLVVSPEGENGSLSVYQQARVFAGEFHAGDHATLNLPAERFAYVHVAVGEIEVNGVILHSGDGARVRDERRLSFTGRQKAEVLVFELRAQELPQLL